MYGLFQHLARSPQGRMLLKRRFLQPSMDLDTIKQRLEAVSVFTRPENTTATAKVSKSMGSIVDVRRLLIGLRTGVSTSAGRAGVIANRVWKGLQGVGTLSFSNLEVACLAHRLRSFPTTP